MLEFEYLVNVLNRVERELDRQTEERIIKLEGAKELISILKHQADEDKKGNDKPFTSIYKLHSHTEHVIAKNPTELNEELGKVADTIFNSVMKSVKLSGRVSLHVFVESLADGYSSATFTFYSDNPEDLLTFDTVMQKG